MKIKAPKTKGKYPDRFEDCQVAIEDGLIDLIGAASTAGWSQQEVITAIGSVSVWNLKPRTRLSRQPPNSYMYFPVSIGG